MQGFNGKQTMRPPNMTIYAVYAPLIDPLLTILRLDIIALKALLRAHIHIL